MSKPKGKLDSLPDDEHFKLVNWLLAGMTYDKALQVVQLEFGISTSIRALGEFWEEYCEQPFLERRRGAARLSSAIRKEAQQNPEDFSAATADLLSHLSFELANKAMATPEETSQRVKDVKTLFTMVLKKQASERQDKSLEFEKEKFRTSLLSKIEAGMEALHVEIKGNPAALAAFNQMKAAIAK